MLYEDVYNNYTGRVDREEYEPSQVVAMIVSRGRNNINDLINVIGVIADGLKDNPSVMNALANAAYIQYDEPIDFPIVLNRPSPDVDRLGYLLWKYVSDQSRLDIFVSLGLLQKTVPLPLSRVTEVVALGQASKDGTLYDIWEAVMPHVPVNWHSPNPFQKNNTQDDQ